MPEAASQLYRKKELLLRLSWKRAFSVLLALTLLLSLAACQSSGNSENPYSGRKLPVLMYHHVVEDGQECNDMTVTVSRLREDLQWLRDSGYTTVLPRELAAGEPLPEKPVLITFDDGYRSNYNLAFPIFQEFEAKMVISVMVYMQDNAASDFITWAMCREMIDSGLIEIGSHTYLLHNLDERGGSFDPEGVNGIQRKPDETGEAFQTRVLDDIQRSYDLIAEKLEVSPTFFAYPFGLTEPDADGLIRELFPVTAVTLPKTADLTGGLYALPRHTVTMNKSLDSILNPPLKTVVKAGIKEFLGLS
jgi:peptidoglycan/xylan/chitin deacetylase (PgdA/CDA1 family)